MIKLQVAQKLRHRIIQKQMGKKCFEKYIYIYRTKAKIADDPRLKED